jgi:hypothetical protein
MLASLAPMDVVRLSAAGIELMCAVDAPLLSRAAPVVTGGTSGTAYRATNSGLIAI